VRKSGCVEIPGTIEGSIVPSELTVSGGVSGACDPSYGGSAWTMALPPNLALTARKLQIVEVTAGDQP
jgi:hypothetical protein